MMFLWCVPIPESDLPGNEQERGPSFTSFACFPLGKLHSVSVGPLWCHKAYWQRCCADWFFGGSVFRIFFLSILNPVPICDSLCLKIMCALLSLRNNDLKFNFLQNSPLLTLFTLLKSVGVGAGAGNVFLNETRCNWPCLFLSFSLFFSLLPGVSTQSVILPRRQWQLVLCAEHF